MSVLADLKILSNGCGLGLNLEYLGLIVCHTMSYIILYKVTHDVSTSSSEEDEQYAVET